MVNTWTDALKEFNKGKSSFSFVKKGTEDYDKVKKIQMDMKNKSLPPVSQPVEAPPLPAPKPKAKRAKKIKPTNIEEPKNE